MRQELDCVDRYFDIAIELQSRHGSRASEKEVRVLATEILKAECAYSQAQEYSRIADALERGLVANPDQAEPSALEKLCMLIQDGAFSKQD